MTSSVSVTRAVHVRCGVRSGVPVTGNVTVTRVVHVRSGVPVTGIVTVTRVVSLFCFYRALDALFCFPFLNASASILYSSSMKYHMPCCPAITTGKSFYL